MPISVPSKLIYPNCPYGSADSSNILKRPKVRVDFPLPVLPTTPILALALTSKLIPWITSSSYGLYLYVKLFILNLPTLGHFLGDLGYLKSF